MPLHLTNPLQPFTFNVYLTYRDTAGSALYQEKQTMIDPTVHELYIDLMCRKQPEAVHTYIRTAEGYRLDETLEVWRHFVLFTV